MHDAFSQSAKFPRDDDEVRISIPGDSTKQYTSCLLSKQFSNATNDPLRFPYDQSRGNIATALPREDDFSRCKIQVLRRLRGKVFGLTVVRDNKTFRRPSLAAEEELALCAQRHIDTHFGCSLAPSTELRCLAALAR